MFDDKTVINKGKCSAADVLQFAIENKWKLEPGDKDMIVMLHEIGYEKKGSNFKAVASLVVKGEDNVRTAMAKTVGLPLGIAAILRLEGKLPVNGLHIPILPAIYEPVLKELARRGHKLAPVESAGATQVVGVNGKEFNAASDPRLNGKSATW